MTRSAQEHNGKQGKTVGFDATKNRYEVELDNVAGNGAISACEKGGEWVNALELLGYLLKDEVELDTITYSAAISACEKGGEWVKALELLGTIVQNVVEASAIAYSAYALFAWYH